jgi:4-amino-4-deoxy-L-arabinose transferase-like glycosyltransferase
MICLALVKRAVLNRADFGEDRRLNATDSITELLQGPAERRNDAGGQGYNTVRVPRSRAILLVLAALTFFVGLGRGAITDSDEAFYAESAFEMVESGDWLTPHYNYEVRFQKPVLYYWLTAATYRLAGVSETAARWWAAMAGLGLVLVTAACARRWYDEDTGWIAGAIVATNFGYFSLARMALPDLPLTFLMTLAIWTGLACTLETQRFPMRWVAASAVALGLGFLMKGPVGLVIPAIVIVPILLLERRSLNLRARYLLLGFLLVLIVAAPWYVAMWMTHGNAYLQSFFVGDNFERFTTDRFNDPRPWWFYLPVVAGGLLPWTPLGLVWLRPIKEFVTRRSGAGVVEVRLLFWALIPLLFFTLSVGKQPRYVLPVLPPLAILLASSIVDRTRDWRGLDGTRTRASRSTALALGAALCGVSLVVFGVLLYRAQPLVTSLTSGYTVASAVIIVVSGLAVIWTARSRAWRAAPDVLALAAAITFAALQYSALSSGGDDSVRQMARLVAQHRLEREEVGTYSVFVRNLVFYARVPTIDIITDDQAEQFLKHTDRTLLVAPAEVVERLERERGISVRHLAEVSYFNQAGLRVGALLQPDPERDITRVVLVSNR